MKFLNMMDELIRQILLINEQERRKLVQIINASFELFEEGNSFFENDFAEENIAIILQRIEDMENEKPCLIEFDDHISILL